MFFLLAVGVFALQSRADPTVSLKRTASVAALLEDLSVRSGTPLSASKALGKEILIVAVDRVPLSEAMNRIAWAAYGTWEKVGNGYRLVADSEAERKAERHYAKWQATEAAAAIGGFRARVLQRNTAPELSRRQLERQGRRAGGPPNAGERALAQALGLVRPETTIFMRPDSEAVYSDAPIGNEFGFGPGIAHVLQSYNDANPNAEPVVHALLTCRYVFENLTATLHLYTKNNYIANRIEATFPLYGPDAGARPKEFADEVPNVEVPLSEASRFQMREVRMVNAFPVAGEMAKHPDLVERLRNPERYEPMATFTTDVWRAVAASKGLNLVANVDDAYLFPGSWTLQKPELGEAFRVAGGYNAELSKGWMVARPSLPNAPWHHRIDRAALGRLARTNARSGSFAEFEARSDYAGAQKLAPDPWTTNQILAWMDVPTPNLYRGWLPLRMYGCLPVAMRQALRAGRDVPIANIPPSAQKALEPIVSHANGNRYESYDHFNIRPAYWFDNGLLMQGFLTGVVTNTQGFNWRFPSGIGNWTTAQQIGVAVRDMEARKSPDLPNLELQEATMTELILFAKYPPGGVKEIATLREAFVGRQAFSPWKNLSPAAQQAIRDR
ncbi:MAG: hypothetical protein ACO1SV_13005 [Fimbriimonas sp.]